MDCLVNKTGCLLIPVLSLQKPPNSETRNYLVENFVCQRFLIIFQETIIRNYVDAKSYLFGKKFEFELIIEITVESAMTCNLFFNEKDQHARKDKRRVSSLDLEENKHLAALEFT